MKSTVLTALFGVVLGSALNGQTPTIAAVADVATYNTTNPRLAPGSLAAIFGNNFGTSKSIAVMFGSKQAYLIAVTNTQINLEIPVDAPLGATTVTVGTSAPFNVTLTRYAPAVFSANGKGTGQAKFFVGANQGPFKAGDAFAVTAVGLGPTTPAVATGTPAPSPAPATSSTVTATIGGAAAPVTFAGLAPGLIGLFQVNVTVPAGLPTGNLALVLTVGGASSQADLTVPTSVSLPTITSVVNAGSSIIQGLPNGGIAQGAIFVAFGSNMGPAALAVDHNPFTSTSLLGTSMSISVNGTTVKALMYYTAANQVAGLLPSNTPLGAGTIRVTYNGTTSAPAPITVVQNNLGIITWTSDGAGVGLVTYPDYSLVSSFPGAVCGGPYTTCGAAKPGDVLTLWATGLGPVSGSDSSPSQLGINMPDIPLKLWIGGVRAKVSYQGRSGCCIGVDQVVFTVPAGAPTGCAVPLAVQINDQISNYTAIPVASGSRICAPSDATLSGATAVIQQLTSGTPISFGHVKLNRRPTKTGPEDRGDVQFSKISVPAALEPLIVSLLDGPSPGTCTVFNNLNPKAPTTYLKLLGAPDAGPSITVNGPHGSRALPKDSGTSAPTDYFAVLGPGDYLSPGQYTITGPAGANIGPFTATITIPQQPVWTNQASITSVNRANGLTVTWTGGASPYITIFGAAATDSSATRGAIFACVAPGAVGTFTVPPSVLLALPAGPGEVVFEPNANSTTFTANGLTWGFVTSNFDTTQFPVTFQ